MNRSDKDFAHMRREARASAPARWSRRELAQVTLLKDAHQETLAPLLRDCPVRLLTAGEVLLGAGDSCDALYLVLSGRLRMADPAAAIPDTLVRAGDSIGELFLFQRAVVAWTISAVEPTRLLVIDRDAAWNLVRASHEIARNWLSLLAERTRVSIIAGSEELKTSHAHTPTHDEPTGLHNRHWLESMLPRQVARSTAAKTPLGLLLVEIDGFAGYTARFGSAAADRACRVTADTLVNNLRPTDLIACYGTGQFAAVLPESGAADACVVGERVRQAVNRAAAVASGDGAVPSLTVAVGVAALQPSADASSLLAAAEGALQTAKASGGNRVGMA